jgi:hypothetical protein
MAELLDVQPIGDSGECLVDALIDGELETARVRWCPDVADLDVLESTSERMTKLCWSDDAIHDAVEAAHERFIGDMCNVGVWYEA